MSGKSFVKGAVVLSVAGILAKCLGALYRIPFGYIASEDCLAIYSMVYPVYNLLAALSTAGIPLAISKLVAEYEEQGKSGMSLRILKLSLLVLSAVGILIGGFIFIKADWLAAVVFPDARVAWSLRAIAPAMVFSCMQAVFRGYFQGLQQMVPTAVSQITEQLVRVSVIIAALFVFMPYGDTIVAAGASAGASVGGCAALLLMLAIFFHYYKKQGSANLKQQDQSLRNSQVIGKVLALAIPISIGSLVLPIMQSIDSLLVVPRLEVGGMSHDAAMAVFSHLGGCVQPIINLPFMLTTAIAASLVPNISEALAMGQKEKLRTSFSRRDANGNSHYAAGNGRADDLGLSHYGAALSHQAGRRTAHALVGGHCAGGGLISNQFRHLTGHGKGYGAYVQLAAGRRYQDSADVQLNRCARIGDSGRCFGQRNWLCSGCGA